MPKNHKHSNSTVHNFLKGILNALDFTQAPLTTTQASPKPAPEEHYIDKGLMPVYRTKANVHSNSSPDNGTVQLSKKNDNNEDYMPVYRTKANVHSNSSPDNGTVQLSGLVNNTDDSEDLEEGIFPFEL